MANLVRVGGFPSRKMNLIVDGVLQTGVSFTSVANNFGGSTVNGHYRYTRQSGEGTAIGKSTLPFDFSGGKKLYIEGYTDSINYNGAGLNPGAITNIDNLTNKLGLETSESVIVLTPTNTNEYIYLYSLSSAYHGFIKNMWIE